MEITIGSIVRIRKEYRVNEEEDWFFEDCEKHKYLFLVTGMETGDFIEYTIVPITKEPEAYSIEANGEKINMIHTDLEVVEITREKLIEEIERISSELSRNWM